MYKRQDEANTHQQTILPPTRELAAAPGGDNGHAAEDGYEPRGSGRRTIRVFAYGVARNRLYQAAQHLGVKLAVVETLEEDVYKRQGATGGAAAPPGRK